MSITKQKDLSINLSSNQIIVNALKKNAMSITSVHVNTITDVTFNARNKEGLCLDVAYHIGIDSDRLTITDENNEDNFAITYPSKGNNRSLAMCMRMALNEVIEHT